jgi:sialate O-acetylesterase
MPDFRPSLAQLQEFNRVREQGTFDYDRQADQWAAANDRGVRDGANWAADTLDMTEWKAMTLPQPWEAAGLPDFDGLVWFVASSICPQAGTGKDLTLSLGPIDDRDTTWINGTKIGATNEYNAPRNYRVTANVLKPGRNILAVRVLDTGGGGGFYGKPEDMKLQIAGDNARASLSLAGEWRYRVSAPLVGLQPPPARFDNNPNARTVLYNGMIAPLVPFGIKGAIWYQGESNAGRAQQYRTLLPTMIRDWRSRFGVGDFRSTLCNSPTSWRPKRSPPTRRGPTCAKPDADRADGAQQRTCRAPSTSAKPQTFTPRTSRTSGVAGR